MFADQNTEAPSPETEAPDVAEQGSDVELITEGDAGGKNWLDIKEAAAYIGVTPMRIRGLLREERLPGAEKVPVEGSDGVVKWQIPVTALDHYQKTKGARGGGKAMVVRVPDAEVMAALEEFCEEYELEAPEPRYKPRNTSSDDEDEDEE